MNPNKALWEKGDFTRVAESMRESQASSLLRSGSRRIHPRIRLPLTSAYPRQFPRFANAARSRADGRPRASSSSVTRLRSGLTMPTNRTPQ
jgi:hypothetical protein